ncbi:hypothetical protein NM688_g8723 [Phlebia brevispora]|uniref:Uncharacterized protein n=1 Tax=Phlebia brevispora TaxID=194682 RepID=A0ACC1RR90_9APHY|nr:hypothetical protein NM688_g8723 [Phlebia brevispora]
MFVDIDKHKLIETFDIVESKSPVFKKIMTADRPMYALRVGRDNSQGYYMNWPDIWPWVRHDESEYSSCKKTSTMREAMEWMITYNNRFKKAEHKEDDSGDLKTEIAGIREALKGFALDIDSKEDTREGPQNLSANVSSLLYPH